MTLGVEKSIERDGKPSRMSMTRENFSPPYPTPRKMSRSRNDDFYTTTTTTADWESAMPTSAYWAT
jgi:hypothetical protein